MKRFGYLGVLPPNPRHRPVDATTGGHVLLEAVAASTRQGRSPVNTGNEQTPCDSDSVEFRRRLMPFQDAGDPNRDDQRLAAKLGLDRHP